MQPYSILIVGPAWVGDMVMTHSLIKVLVNNRPSVKVDMLAPGWSTPIIKRIPEIHENIILPVKHGELALRKRYNIARQLKENSYDQAIILPRSIKAALVPWLAKIPRRTGYKGEMRYRLINDMRPFDQQSLDQTVKRYVALGLELGESLPIIPRPKLTVASHEKSKILSKFNLVKERPIVALIPGAEYGPAKCWPISYFHKLSLLLKESGYDVLVLGSKKEINQGKQISSGSGATNLCGKTSLEEVIDLLACCDCAVSNDSGLLHVSAALGIKVIGIYGSSSPDLTPPLTDNCEIHYLGIECSPCFKRVCPLGHLNCLRNITPETVIETIHLA